MVSVNCQTFAECIHKIKSSGKAVVHYKQPRRREPNRREMAAVCFSTEQQIELYHKYPEVIGIDSTYNTNDKGWVV